MALFRKRSAVVSAAAVAGMLLMSGCASGEGGQEAAASPTAAAPSAARSERPPLTAEQLTALALRDSEIPNSHGAPVKELRPESGGRSFPPVSDASCQRLIDVLDGEAAAAVVGQIFNWKGDIWGGSSTLASYEGPKAQDEFRAARDSLKTCKSFTGVGWTGEYAAEITVEKAPDLGDEALGFHLISQLPDSGGQRDEHHVLVRVGGVVVDLQKLNVGAKAQFPLDLVKKQVDKLSTAQKS